MAKELENNFSTTPGHPQALIEGLEIELCPSGPENTVAPTKNTVVVPITSQVKSKQVSQKKPSLSRSKNIEQLSELIKKGYFSTKENLYIAGWKGKGNKLEALLNIATKVPKVPNEHD
ncbi:hypothetical protein KJ855_03280 [Patescibacteria group bacterium]|nr:hypothetical protein [Patescibacteria group bacterium]